MPKHESNEVMTFKAIPHSFFCRPAELVAPDLIGCKLVKKKADGSLLSGVIVETEAYSQAEPACHGYKRRTPSNETLFGDPGHLYVYLTYGIYHCTNVVTDRNGWASGVLLRAVAIAGESERVASGPALLSRYFDLNCSHDSCFISVENGLWLAERSASASMQKIVSTTRIGISEAKELPWRWYLQASRSVSKRAKGDRCPPLANSWRPIGGTGQ